jgi:hypothetical protein
MRQVLRAVAATALIATVAACESSQDKSARLRAQGAEIFTEKGLDVRRASREVRVVTTEVLQDQNGAAAVVVMRSTSQSALRGVPVEIDVRGKGGKSVFKNNEPGLQDSLTGPSVLSPASELAWVHDQVVADGRATSVKATPGAAAGSIPGELPSLAVSEPQLRGDPVSGVEATGTVENTSSVEQRELVLYCVARKDGRIVAAGRGAIPRLKAGQKRTYHIFFIGDPKGAKLTVEAPPTTFDRGES